MKLFGQIVRTVVNTAALPVAVAKDVVTCHGMLAGDGESSTSKALRKLKAEADEDA